ncbi:hypothetical protein [Nitrosomonas sp. Nm132]|uniref:hypothetical protein n=1 Tax=Nitrosomonas sp. Nm132 TaxID=1881053 RepID=UPI00115F7BCD|nr:hypothetical protein [Nitrosomonas sp. Nm132]
MNIALPSHWPSAGETRCIGRVATRLEHRMLSRPPPRWKRRTRISSTSIDKHCRASTAPTDEATAQRDAKKLKRLKQEVQQICAWLEQNDHNTADPDGRDIKWLFGFTSCQKFPFIETSGRIRQR